VIWQILFATLLGIFAGTISGLAPGIHVNLVSVLLLTAAPFLLQFADPLVLVVFIVSMAITHSFLDFLPTTYLGAPDSDTALAVLPAHKLLLHGRGFEAVKLSAIGCMLSLVLAAMLIPLTLPALQKIAAYLQPHLGIVLGLVIAFMIFKDEHWRWNLTLFLLSSSLGLIVLNLPLKDPLFPMLSGLFGISTLLLSLNDAIRLPHQMQTETLEIQRPKILKSVAAGTVTGFLTAFLPGLGPAQGAVLASQFVRGLGDYGFLILTGAMGTVNFAFSLGTWAMLDKARNGAIASAMELQGILSQNDLLILIGVMLFAGGISCWLMLRLARMFAKWIVLLPYRIVVLIVLAGIILLVGLLTGPLGLVVLMVSTAIGMLAPLQSIPRNHAMGCLLMPVMLFFLL